MHAKHFLNAMVFMKRFLNVMVNTDETTKRCTRHFVNVIVRVKHFLNVMMYVKHFLNVMVYVKHFLYVMVYVKHFLKANTVRGTLSGRNCVP